MRILLAVENEVLAILIKRSFQRFKHDWKVVSSGFDAFQACLNHRFDAIICEFDLPRMTAVEMMRRLNSLKDHTLPPTIVLTMNQKQRAEVEKEHLTQCEIIAWPLAARSIVNVMQRMLHVDKRVVCIGGGTGLFTLLSGLKTLPGVYLSAIVGMSDDGGSTGRLRDIFGILPPGDVRRSLVALSKAPDLLNELMQFRFSRGGELEGHSLGNLILTALSEMRGSMTDAVKAVGRILDIQGEVIPVTEDVNTLHAELMDGTRLEGESRIDLFKPGAPDHQIKKLWQEPATSATFEAVQAIYNADYLILGPGDLYTSIICNLVVEGISEAILGSQAKKIYICNVMTKPGETNGFDVSDHVVRIKEYLGRDVLDYVFCSDTQISDELLMDYELQNQIPVVQQDQKKLAGVTTAKVIWGDFASDKELLRHDSLKLAKEFKKIIDFKQKK